MRKFNELATALIIYFSIIALIGLAAFILFSINGCGEIPATQQTTKTETRFIRIVQVDKDGSSTVSKTQKIKVKQ